jgi:uncharacterized protein YPO0396
LVHFRVRPARASDTAALHPDSLVRKLAIKPDSPFYSWLMQQLAQRFDYACCAHQEQFRRELREAVQAKMDAEAKAGGELDTHGFAILHQLRQHFPQTESLLMDQATLM